MCLPLPNGSFMVVHNFVARNSVQNIRYLKAERNVKKKILFEHLLKICHEFSLIKCENCYMLKIFNDTFNAVIYSYIW